MALSRLLQAEMLHIHAQQHQQVGCWKEALDCLTTICQQETRMLGSESGLAWSWQDVVMAAQVEAGRCSQMCGVRPFVACCLCIAAAQRLARTHVSWLVCKSGCSASECNLAMQAGLDLFQNVFGSPQLAQHPCQHAAALIMQAQLAEGLQRRQHLSSAEVHLTGSRDIEQEVSAVSEGAAAKKAASQRSKASPIRKRAAASTDPEQATQEKLAELQRQMQWLLTACSLSKECPTLLR